MGSECPGIIQSSTSPSATIYYIDFEATRILPSGPGSDIRINDFYSAGGGKYIPPEGVDALDPYAYDIYSLGILYDAIFRVSSSFYSPLHNRRLNIWLVYLREYNCHHANSAVYVPVRRVVAGEGPCSSTLDLPSEAVVAGFADVGARDAMALQNRQT